VVSIPSNEKDSSTAGTAGTAGGRSQLASTTDSKPLAGINERRSRNYRASASENPLALFEKAERSRRWRRRRHTAHLRYGQLDPAIERSIEIERPPLSELDEAEIERLLAKHADTAEGHR
jgi:hypothetical protein